MLIEHRAILVWFFPLFADSLFCDLPLKSLKSLAGIKHKKRFQKDAIIFAAGDISCCIYSLLKGQAQILLNTDLHIFRPVELNEIFGLTETIADLPFKITLKTITSCEFEFMENGDFLRFLHDEPEVCFQLIKSLGVNFQESYKLSFSAIK